MNKNKRTVENKRKRLLSLPILIDTTQIAPTSSSVSKASSTILCKIKYDRYSVSSLSNSDDDLTLLKKSKSDIDSPTSSDFQSQVIVQNVKDWEPRSSRKVTFSLIDENLPRRLSNEIELKPEWLKSNLLLRVLYLMYSDKSNPLDELPSKNLIDDELQNSEVKMQELRRAVERMRHDLTKNCSHNESHSGSVTPKELLQSLPEFIKRHNKPAATSTHLSVGNAINPSSSTTPIPQSVTPPIQNQASKDNEESSNPTSKRPQRKFEMTPMEKNMLAPISF